MKKRPDVVKKPSKLDTIAEETANAFAHQDSGVIHSEVRMLRIETEELDKAIITCTATLTAARERRTVLAAQLRGLMDVVNKRR